jgi:hypothetical protein
MADFIMVHCSVFIIYHTKAHSIFAPSNSTYEGEERNFQVFHSRDVKSAVFLYVVMFWGNISHPSSVLECADLIIYRSYGEASKGHAGLFSQVIIN